MYLFDFRRSIDHQVQHVLHVPALFIGLADGPGKAGVP